MQGRLSKLIKYLQNPIKYYQNPQQTSQSREIFKNFQPNTSKTPSKLTRRKPIRSKNHFKITLYNSISQRNLTTQISRNAQFSHNTATQGLISSQPGNQHIQASTTGRNFKEPIKQNRNHRQRGTP